MQIDQLAPFADSKTETCSRHGDFTAQHIYRGRYATCGKCADERQQATNLREAAEKKAREDAGREQRIASLIDESGLIGRQLRSTFESYEARDARQVSLLADCQAYMDLFIKGQPAPKTSLWLLGLPGTGKSHLGAAMVNHIIRGSAVPARMHSGQDIIRMLRATWNRQNPPMSKGWEDQNGYHSGQVITETELIESIAGCKLLVLDEIGVSHGSNSEAVQLFEVLDLRYKLEKPTVVLSNLAPPALKASLGDRLYDRLREGATVKACEWKSYRGEFSSRVSV